MLNAIFAFDYYDGHFLGLCVAQEKDGTLICYRVKEKDIPIDSAELLVEHEHGNNPGLVVDYRCKFRLPLGCVRKYILKCDTTFVQRINDCYQALPPLGELIKKRKELQVQFRHSSNISKSVVKQLNALTKEINARKPFFLMKKTIKRKSAYTSSSIRITPNADGISCVYSGGGCTSK